MLNLSNVFIEFVSGKSITLKKSTGTKEKVETFTTEDGKKYQADALVIYFGKGKKPVHYRMSQIKRYEET